MKLFLKIYSYLLIGITGLLAIDANLSYERAIAQFDIDMTRNAEQIGTLLSGMISHAWHESGQQTALQLIADADASTPATRIRWIWLDEPVAGDPENHSGPPTLTALAEGRSLSFIRADNLKQKHRYTYVPVIIPGPRSGALELSQSLIPLIEYTRQTLIRSLVITSLLALVSGVIIYVFIHIKIRGPLDRLARKAIQIGKGDIDPNLDIKGNDELTDLANIMNDMCTRLLIAKEKIHFEHEARVKTLEQLRHTDRLSTIGQIAAGIAHEIGTPLNVVDGRAKMIMNERLDRDETVDCARIIRNQAERITSIIRQLLDFSRRRKPRKSAEKADLIVRQVFHLLSPLAAKQGATLELAVEPDTELKVHIDGSQIQQVFMNVIMNSIQAMPAAGTIRVALANERLRSNERTDGQQKEYLKIAISDEGEGIPEAHQEQIFEPFFTTKQAGSGTGLGLSIARELLEEHGGWIEIASSNETGTCFSLYLPSYREAHA